MTTDTTKWHKHLTKETFIIKKMAIKGMNVMEWISSYWSPILILDDCNVEKVIILML